MGYYRQISLGYFIIILRGIGLLSQEAGGRAPLKLLQNIDLSPPPNSKRMGARGHPSFCLRYFSSTISILAAINAICNTSSENRFVLIGKSSSIQCPKSPITPLTINTYSYLASNGFFTVCSVRYFSNTVSISRRLKALLSDCRISVRNIRWFSLI